MRFLFLMLLLAGMLSACEAQEVLVCVNGRQYYAMATATKWNTFTVHRLTDKDGKSISCPTEREKK